MHNTIRKTGIHNQSSREISSNRDISELLQWNIEIGRQTEIYVEGYLEGTDTSDNKLTER